MATGSPPGHIALWNLEDRCLSSTLRYAHDGCVSGMKFLQSQPLLASASPDNSLKVRFDPVSLTWTVIYFGHLFRTTFVVQRKVNFSEFLEKL